MHRLLTAAGGALHGLFVAHGARPSRLEPREGGCTTAYARLRASKGEPLAAGADSERACLIKQGEYARRDVALRAWRLDEGVEGWRLCNEAVVFVGQPAVLVRDVVRAFSLQHLVGFAEGPERSRTFGVDVSVDEETRSQRVLSFGGFGVS